MPQALQSPTSAASHEFAEADLATIAKEQECEAHGSFSTKAFQELSEHLVSGANH